MALQVGPIPTPDVPHHRFHFFVNYILPPHTISSFYNCPFPQRSRKSPVRVPIWTHVSVSCHHVSHSLRESLLGTPIARLSAPCQRRPERLESWNGAGKGALGGEQDRWAL